MKKRILFFSQGWHNVSSRDKAFIHFLEADGEFPANPDSHPTSSTPSAYSHQSGIDIHVNTHPGRTIKITIT